MPERFAIDRAALEQAYRRLQATVHPDRFGTGSPAEQRVALQWATLANEAVRVLRDPIARAAYLCERHGAPIHAESNTAMPREFLQTQLQWREALEQADDDADADGLDRLQAEAQTERDRCVEALADAIDRRADFAAGAELTRQLMFIDRLLRELGERAAHRTR